MALWAAVSAIVKGLGDSAFGALEKRRNQQRIRRVVEAADLAERVVIGMAFAPVMVLAAYPVVNFEALAVDDEMPVEAHVGARYHRFGFRERPIVERLR